MDGTSRCGVQWARRCCARVIGWGRQFSTSGLVSYTCITSFICLHPALKYFKATAKHRCGLLWIKITRPPPIFCVLVVPPNDLRFPVLFETGSANYRCSNFVRISSTYRAIRLLLAVLDRDLHPSSVRIRPRHLTIASSDGVCIYQVLRCGRCSPGKFCFLQQRCARTHVHTHTATQRCD